MNEIQLKLREIQKKAHLTQTVLAQELGVSFPTLNAWWGAKSLPRKDAVKRIDALYSKYTGKISIPSGVYTAVYEKIKKESKKYNVLDTILSRKDIHDNLIAKLTYHSDAIEGSTLTLKETAAVIFDNATIKNRTVVEQMEARNHKAALVFLLDTVQQGHPINEDFIKKVHLIVFNGILDSTGIYRSHPVRIVGTHVVTANYMKIPDLMKGIDKRLQKQEGDVVSFVSKLHADFEKIHPFSDGNGRVGRLLINAILLKNNLAPAIIETDLRHLYYTYLEIAQEKEDYSFIELFIAEAILKGFKEIV